MEVKQSCDVCGEEGRFLAGQVRIVGLSWPHRSHVAQCPECRRFFCLQHCEGLPVEPGSDELRLCCPLCLDTPLGDPDEEGHLFVADKQDV